ncbi:MAG TPA: OsmC family peroxiredoxin [Opitutales bacterium]|nr:OsmC family peroxiredoxin [Opitutales bacterium]
MEKITRSADANWKGNLDEGHGLVSLQSRAFTEERFSFAKRIDQEQSETNPEELIAGAAASCFGMALSKTLQDDGQASEKLRVKADVTLGITDDGPKVTDLKLAVEAILPEYDEDQLEAAVKKTAENCPIFQLLKPGFESVAIESSLQR